MRLRPVSASIVPSALGGAEGCGAGNVEKPIEIAADDRAKCATRLQAARDAYDEAGVRLYEAIEEVIQAARALEDADTRGLISSIEWQRALNG